MGPAASAGLAARPAVRRAMNSGVERLKRTEGVPLAANGETDGRKAHREHHPGIRTGMWSLGLGCGEREALDGQMGALHVLGRFWVTVLCLRGGVADSGCQHHNSGGHA